MDPEGAKKFINSLVKNLQVLCHGHVNFSNSIQVIGHLYLNVDSNVNIDYIVNEQVCKNDTSSTAFISKSYYSEPQNKSDKNTTKETTINRTDQIHNERLNETSQDNTSCFERIQNQNAGENNDRKKSRKRSQSQFVIHPPKIPKTSNSPAVSPLRLGVQSSDFPPTEHSSLDNANASPFTSSYDDGNHCVDEKPFQVIPPIDVDITSIKSEPIESSTNDVCSFQEQTSASGQGNFHESTEDPMDDMSNDEFLIGLRDKSLGLYPVAMHPSELNTSFGTSSQSVSQSSPSSLPSLPMSSGELVPGSSSSSALFYSSPMSVPDVEGRYRCRYCDKSFVHRSNLSRHIKERHRNIRLYCPCCGKACTQKDSTNCSICGAKYQHKSSLNVHIREQHLGYMVTCHICGRNFTRKTSLTRHIISSHKT